MIQNTQNANIALPFALSITMLMNILRYASHRNHPMSTTVSPDLTAAQLAALHKERLAIDATDAQILQLLNQRARHAQTIGHIKGSAVVYRPDREADVLRQLQALNQGPLSQTSVTRLFREIMSECLALERPLTIAYLGPAGTYSEQAARQQFGHAALLMPCPSFDAIVKSVSHGAANYALLPIENSSEGAVTQTLDLLLQTPLTIIGETTIKVDHCLMQQTLGERIDTIMAHPQALAQCQTWLRTQYPHATLLPVASNAVGAQQAQTQAHTACIASLETAALFRLSIVAEHIQDTMHNATRFIVLGQEKVGRTGQDKTAIVLTSPHKAGAIYSLLGVLAQHGISMLKLESRPAKLSPWEYVFFIDLEGHETDANVALALAELQTKANFLKVLGSYPVSPHAI
jgi:chorismate mutase/prephenate dehydratase